MHLEFVTITCVSKSKGLGTSQQLFYSSVPGWLIPAIPPHGLSQMYRENGLEEENNANLLPPEIDIEPG